MRYEILINEEHTGYALRGLRTRCPIAAAIMDCVPNAKHVRVDENTVRWSDPDTGERYVWRTPPRAAAFVRSWDGGRETQPILFSLADKDIIRIEPKKSSRPTRDRITITHKPIVQPGRNITRAPCGEDET